MKRVQKPFLCFTLMTILFIIFSIIFSSDTRGLFINVVAVLIMFGTISYGLGIKSKKTQGIHQLKLAADSLKRATATILDIASDPECNIEDILDNQEEAKLFDHESLHQAYLAHRNELDRLYRDKSDFRYVDIADFINQDTLNHIAKSQFNDLVSGTMTGMGILGTFIGLMIGLQDFDPSSAQAMMETIPPLIDGIKVAFLTSIFGVIYSIVFNMTYRGVSEEATSALEEFQAAYYKYVSPRPENDGFTKLIQYQQSQAESMSQFAEQISLTMAQALGTSVIPTFERIETTIQQLSDKLAATQDQNMERIAADFIGKMDELMGDQMKELGENIKKLNTLQTEAADSMQKTVAEMATAGGSIGSVSENLQSSVATMASYLQRMEEMQGNLQEEYSVIVERFTKVSEDVQKQHDSMLDILGLEQDSLKAMQAMHDVQAQRLEEEKQAIQQYRTDVKQFCQDVQGTIQESTTSMLEKMSSAISEQINQLQQSTVEINNVQHQIIAEFRKCCEEICKNMDGVSIGTAENIDKILQQRVQQIDATMQKIDEAQKLFVKEMASASEQLGKASNQISNASTDLTTNLDKAMSRTYQEIDRQLAEIVRHLSGTITDIREVTEKVPQMLSLSAEQMQSNTAEYLEKLNTTQQELLNAIRQFTQQIEE